MKKLVITVVVISLVVMIGEFISAPIEKLEQLETRTVVIQSGDTLWSIAKSSNVNVDTRTVVSFIRDRNNCDAVIKAGERLEVPYRNKNTTLAKGGDSSESDSTVRSNKKR